MKKFNKVLLKSKAKSFYVHFKKGQTTNNYIGVMQLWVSYYKKGIKTRRYKANKIFNNNH